MRRTYMVGGVGEVNPEAAADTLFVALWAAVITALAEFAPGLLASILAAEWYYLFIGVAISLTVAYAVVHAPLAYYGLIWRDAPEASHVE